MPEEKNLKVISEKAYLITFSVFLTVISILLLSWFIPKGFIEYNFGISIVTSLVSTDLTVVFLSVFLAIREEREWRTVKKSVYSMISMQSGLLFGELLRFTEKEIDEVGFKYSLLYIKDVKIRKEMIFSKLSELNKKEPLQLTLSDVSVFRSDKELLKLFLDIKRDIGDIQIRYGRHLTSKITERLIKIQDALELVNLSFEMDSRWNKLQGQLPLLRDLVNKLTSNQTQDHKGASIDLFQDLLSTCIKAIVQEIFELWKVGIEFEFA